MKHVAILGSTGSIGVNTLDVIRHRRRDFQVVGLSAYRNMELLARQIREFRPRLVSVKDDACARQLKRLVTIRGLKILPQDEGLEALAGAPRLDILVVATSGTAGLRPTLTAIRRGVRVALANKEPLVMAGEIIMKALQASGATLIPVDSEHSAIFQCLQNAPPRALRRIYLTGSGGPFRNWTRARLKQVTPARALRHPKWKMGSKITIDSATLMNKGLEIIEARWLFNIPAEHIEVLIHPDAIIHSLVEFQDRSLLAQLGVPDMRIPIQYALDYPERVPGRAGGVDFVGLRKLSFFAPRSDAFPCLRIAQQAARAGGTSGCVMNAANEIAVEAFLAKQIGFMDIPRTIERVMCRHRVQQQPRLNDIMALDTWARREAYSFCYR